MKTLDLRRWALTAVTLFFTVSGVLAQNDTLRWEADIRTFELLDSTQLYDPHAIMFVGSSSIRMWKTIAEDMSPYAVIQRGYGGAKLSDLNYYLPRIVTPKHRFDALVLYVANDINGGKKDIAPKEVLKLFQQTIKIIRKDHKTEPIFFVEMSPTPKRAAVWNQLKEANELIEKYCSRKRNLKFIPTAKEYLDHFNQPKKELFLKDGLHYNQEGYNIWARLIKAQLELYVPKN